MKTAPERIRNAAFFAQLVAVGLGLATCQFRSGRFFLWSITACFGLLLVAGLVVIVMSLRLREGLMRKLAFLLAGASPLGFVASFPLDRILERIARSLGQPKPFGPDGFPEFYGLVVLPVTFLVGAVGALAFLIRGVLAKRKTPG